MGRIGAGRYPGLSTIGCLGDCSSMDHILEASKNVGVLGWYNYNESFRQKLSLVTQMGDERCGVVA